MLPARAKLYIFSMIALGAGMLGYGLWNWHSADWARYAFYLAISAVASGMKITLSAGSGTMSMNFLFILTGIESLSLGESLVMGSIGILVQRFFSANKRPSLTQALFNVASMACAVGVAYATYHSGERGWLQAPILLLLAAIAFFLANTLSVAIVIGLTENKSPWTVWRETYFWSFPNYLVGAAVAWGLNAISHAFGWQASLLLLPVLYVIYRSHRMYVDRLQEEKNQAERQRQHAEELASLHRRTIETLAVAVEAKDQTTRDHLARVEIYAMEIGRELGLSANELKALEAAALLHDIGKLAVPEYIVSKPGKLTPEEFEKMKVHPVVGAELVEQVQFPYPVAPIVRAHHEKWDGSGYPDGLIGEAIPIGARILSVVDCMDALASDRQYRRAIPLPDAMAMVQKESGKSFDPRIVDLLASRYVELEKKAKANVVSHKAKLSTDVKIERGAAPAAGFEESAEKTSQGLISMHQSIQDSSRQAATLERFRAQLQQSADSGELFAALRECVSQEIPYQALVVYRRRGECLIPEYLDGEGQAQFASLEIPLGAGLAGWVAENRKTIINGNPSVEPGYLNDPTKFSTLGSALAVPLETLSGIAGVLSLYRKDRDAFRTQEMQWLLLAAAPVGSRIEQVEQITGAVRS